LSLARRSAAFGVCGETEFAEGRIIRPLSATNVNALHRLRLIVCALTNHLPRWTNAAGIADALPAQQLARAPH
jgi:hypothetical protein